MAIEVQNGALMFAKMLLKMAGPEDVNHATYILAKALVETHEDLTTTAADNERLRTDLRCAEIQVTDRGNSFAEMKAENERLRDLLPRCDGPMCKPSTAAEPLHPCPYKDDVDGNSTDLCNCCETCRLECERNI